MTVHVISVGLTVLDALNGKNGKFDRAVVRKRAGRLLETEGIRAWERDKASEWMAAALTPGSQSPQAQSPQAQALREAIAGVTPGLWPRDVSAEIETFGRVDPGGLPLRKTDISVLVCSDTSDGLLAGVWNALRLTGGELSLVRYLPTPDSPLGEAHGHVLLVRVPKLDAGTAAGFREAMGGLGVLARQLLKYGKLEKAEEFRFYLSGGFKAAIPYLIGLAEAVRSVDKVRLGELGVPHLMPDQEGMPYPVRAFVLHETTRVGAVELPLRYLIAELVREELSGFDTAGVRHRIRGDGLLVGYAYDAPGKPGKETCTLTPFGEGLRELFGVEPE